MIATTLASNYEAQVQRKKSFLKPFLFIFFGVWEFLQKFWSSLWASRGHVCQYYLQCDLGKVGRLDGLSPGSGLEPHWHLLACKWGRYRLQVQIRCFVGKEIVVANGEKEQLPTNLTPVPTVAFRDPFHVQDFPGIPAVKILHFHCRGVGLLPGQGTTTPSCCVTWPKKKILIMPYKVPHNTAPADLTRSIRASLWFSFSNKPSFSDLRAFVRALPCP